MVSLRARTSERIVTAVSCRSRACPTAPSKSQLARKSLLVALAMFASTGCIVADPPQYEEPKRTPPFLDLSRAEPSPYWLVVIDRNDPLGAHSVKITIPIRSDDQGERVWFGVHVDFKTDNGVVLGSQPMAPSTFDVTRTFSSPDFQLNGLILQGCHQLTLVVAHESSWDYTHQQPKLDAPKDDIAVATWWMNVDPPPTDPFTLTRCPNQSEVQK